MAGETSREKLQAINLGTGSKFSYRQLSRRVDGILAMSGNERHQAMVDLYKEIILESANAGLTRRAVCNFNQDLYEKYFQQTHQNINGTAVMVGEMLGAMCREKGTDYVAEERFGVDIDEYANYLRDIARGYTIARAFDEFYKVADHRMMKEYLTLATRQTANYKYAANIKDSFDRGIAETYYGYTKQLEELNSHGFFWKMFHPIKNSRLKEFVKDTKKFLDKVGFDIEVHGEDALNSLYTNIDRITEQDFAKIESYTKAVKNEEKEKQNPNKVEIEQITVARDKYRAAEEMENKFRDPKTKAIIGSPLYKALDPIFQKYGLTYPKSSYPSGIPTGTTMGGELGIARGYDESRDISNYSTYMDYGFRKNFMNLFAEAVKSDKQISIGEIMKDASLIPATIANTYTLLYDAPETQELARQTTFGSYTVEKTMELAKKILTEQGKIENYDLDAMTKEVEETLNTYKSPFIRSEEPKLEQSNILEDIQEVDEEKEQDLIENENPMREEIVVVDAIDDVDKIQEKVDNKNISSPQKTTTK